MINKLTVRQLAITARNTIVITLFLFLANQMLPPFPTFLVLVLSSPCHPLMCTLSWSCWVEFFFIVFLVVDEMNENGENGYIILVCTVMYFCSGVKMVC